MAPDQEMIALLDKYFRETQKVVKEEIQGLREEFAQQFQAVREETAQQIQGLREETMQRFAEMEKAIQRNSEETRRNSEVIQSHSEAIQCQSEEIRHLGVRIEGLESTIQTVAEGVVGNNESLAAFRGEVAREFKEVRATMQLHYRDLDRRVRLEQRDAAKKVVKKAAKKTSAKKASRGN